MNCAAAHEQMLSAGLAELTGETATPLAQHITKCASCRARARRIIDGYRELDAGLAALAPAQRRAPRVRWRWAAVPLAAAALLALLLTRDADTPAIRPNAQLLSLMFPAEPVATPPAGQQALVFEKDDMTIVWLY
jgi:hypothetical protein